MSNRSPPSLILVVVLLSACATPAPVSKGEVAGIRRVGVVSVAANVFTRQYVGLTVFGNEHEDKDVLAWGLDKEYAEQVGKAAASLLGATYVSAPYSYGEFSKVNDLNGPWDAPAFWGPNWTKIEEVAKSHCGANHLDALLVVAKQKQTESGSNQFVYPMGIQSRLTWAKVVLSTRLGLIDCAAGKLRNSRLVNFGDSWLSVRYPQAQIPRELGARPIAEWNADTETEMKS